MENIEDNLYDEYRNSLEKSQENLKYSNKIINANEAKELLEQKNKEVDKQLEDIMRLIYKAIDRHENYCYIPASTLRYTIKKLIGLGYIVGTIEIGDRTFDSQYRKVSF